MGNYVSLIYGKTGLVLALLSTEFPGRCCSIKPTTRFFVGASLEVDCWCKSEHTWHRSWSQASRYPASVHSRRTAISAGSPLLLFLAEGARIHQDLFLNPSSPRWVVPLAWQPRERAGLRSPGACWLCGCPTPRSPPGLRTLPAAPTGSVLQAASANNPAGKAGMLQEH